ncbi:TPA: hypothetical protein N0F65_012522, partial [Lagenidium giganteum]
RTILWQKGPVIGGGRFGQVFLGLRVPSADFLAIKQVFVQEEIDQGHDTSTLSMQRVVGLDKIEREIEIIGVLDHPNIVRFIGTERYGPTVHIFMEYMQCGSLSRILSEFGAFEEVTIRQYIRDVVRGVHYLHALGIAHRDLKCANLLLDDDGVVKITDFGTAKRVNDIGSSSATDSESPDTARSVREGVGTPYWMAPEIVRAEKGEDCWRKADIWGVGCLMIEMATTRPPWENYSNPLTAMFHIASDDAIPQLPSHLSTVAQDFLLQCFQKDARRRPSAEELLAHHFLATEVSEVSEHAVASAINDTPPEEPVLHSHSHDQSLQPPEVSDAPVSRTTARSSSTSGSSSSRSSSSGSSSSGSCSSRFSSSGRKGPLAYSSDEETTHKSGH